MNSPADLALAVEVERELRRRGRPQPAEPTTTRWYPTHGVYVNRDTRKPYEAHHEAERLWVESDAPRNMLAKGGEGGGKSVAGIVKALERVRRGMSGIMVSPDLPHFRRSLWKEFQRWCPWDEVVASQRYRGDFAWEPQMPFTLAFLNGATIGCGGIEQPRSWEGPNVSWYLFDEARRHRTPDALKVLDGRIRIPGPNGEPPQGFITTTPEVHWLYDYFGPIKDDDDLEGFKLNSVVVDLLTIDNERAGNLPEGWTRDRSQSLTEAEARVLLNAEWEDVDTTGRFLPTMTWWDSLAEVLPPLGKREPVVLAADAGVSGDTFALVGVSRHPLDPKRIAVRYVRVWVPPRGGVIDFDPIEQEVGRVCKNYHVLQFTYDPYQLHQMGTRLLNSGKVWASPFPQGDERLEADRGLLEAIKQATIAHDGDVVLRDHVSNADRKVDGEDRKIRIVKRSTRQKVDAAVALSMAYKRFIELGR